MKSSPLKIAVKFFSIASMLALTGCFSVRNLNLGDAFAGAFQPVGEAMVVSAAAQEYRKSSGQWPTNEAEFSEAFAGSSWTNEFSCCVPSIKYGLADLKLVPLTNGSLSISYRAFAPDSNALTMNIVVSADGQTSIPGFMK